MTSKRNLGPVLALTGAGIAVAAVITGFIVTGGPGDARDRRLDDMTMARVVHLSRVAQCAYNLTGTTPATVQEGQEISARSAATGADDGCAGVRASRRADPAGTGAAPGAPDDATYEKLDDSHVRLCDVFRRPFDPKGSNVESFNPLHDAYHPELTAARPTGGKHCYDITMIDEAKPSGLSWQETIDVEALPPEIAWGAIADKRSIGDVSNVLRLARCARQIIGEAPQSFESGLAAVASEPAASGRHNCDWAPSYFGNADNVPTVTYSRIDANTVSVCATYRHAWPVPLRLNFYDSALTEWPGSAPALQGPVEAGRHCYEVVLPELRPGDD